MSRELELDVTALGARGDGIAGTPQGPVYVPGALPGERVRAALDAKDPSRARLLEVMVPSPGRAAPPCPHFSDCGGCTAQHMGGGVYEGWKREIVAAALAHAGVKANVAPVFRVAAASRRRARLFAARTKAGTVFGFHAGGSHRIVDMRACPVLEPAIFALVQPLRQFFDEILKPGARAEAEVQLVGSALDAVIRTGGTLDRALNARLIEFAAAQGVARISWQALPKGRRPAGAVEVLAAFTPVRAQWGGVVVALPPLAFLQASAAGERALTALVTERVPVGARVADLYCGAGTFTLPLAARAARVAGYDGAADLTEALGRAARAGGLGGRVTATARDLERRPLTARELDDFDCVVFDPPRGGAEAQARQIAASQIPTVVAVSCNPATFARDAKVLIDGGFEIGPVMPVDQFVWTRHVEVVAAFARA